MVHLDYRDARPIYTQIAEGFRSQIYAGILRPGDKLPSVRELAAQLAINPNTIQRAYRELEADGSIVTVTGKGCFVGEKAHTSHAAWQTFDLAAKELLRQGISPQELIAHLQKGGLTDASNA